MHIGSVRKETYLRASYLTGEKVHLRAMGLADKDHAAAWFDQPFPADVTRAETFIKDEHKDLDSREKHLIIALNETDEIVGRFCLWSNGRIAVIWFRMAFVRDDADEIQADVLRITTPWLMNEASMFSLTAEIPSDCTATIAAAEQLGMQPSVRLREHIARAGHRVDLIYYQALGQTWGFPEEAANA